MVQYLLTSLSITSFMTLASCSSISDAALLASRSPPRPHKFYLRPGTVIDYPLAVGGADMHTATGTRDQLLTSASADSSAAFGLAENSRYLYIATYADSECTTLYYGISEKLDSCTPLPNYYLRTAYHKYTLTASGYTLSIYTDSNCATMSKMEESFFIKDCTPSTSDKGRYQKNIVSSSSVFPTSTQHVALR
jgi:hypothetical protein